MCIIISNISQDACGMWFENVCLSKIFDSTALNHFLTVCTTQSVELFVCKAFNSVTFRLFVSLFNCTVHEEFHR